MLEPINTLTIVEEKKVLRKCECCRQIVDSSKAINIMIVVGSPGHEEMAPFQCPAEEHWACSITCWSKVAHACIDEHMSQLLLDLHKEKGLI